MHIRLGTPHSQLEPNSTPSRHLTGALLLGRSHMRADRCINTVYMPRRACNLSCIACLPPVTIHVRVLELHVDLPDCIICRCRYPIFIYLHVPALSSFNLTHWHVHGRWHSPLWIQLPAEIPARLKSISAWTITLRYIPCMSLSILAQDIYLMMLTNT
jgi:hypothetical protein